MDKKVFKFDLPEIVRKEIGGIWIDIKPYLSLSEQAQLLRDYVEQYFHSEKTTVSESRFDVFSAEYTLRLAIIGYCTNVIPTEGKIENLFYTNAYDEILDEIVNYSDFRDMLYTLVKEIKEDISEKNSVGGVIDSLYEKVEILINQLIESTKNISPEELEKLKETGKELVDRITQNPLVQEVFKESGK
jgi:hypothetical protein